MASGGTRNRSAVGGEEEINTVAVAEGCVGEHRVVYAELDGLIDFDGTHSIRIDDSAPVPAFLVDRELGRSQL